MATFVKFEVFAEDLANAEHDLFGVDHVIKFYLTNATPNVATHGVKADLAEIATGFGYAGPQTITTNGTRTGGTVSVSATDVTITASGGTIGPFRYAPVFNDTHLSKALIGYYDYGAAITLQDGDQFVLDFTATILTIA